MFFFVFSLAGKIEKNNLVDIAGSEIGVNVDWLKEKKNCPGGNLIKILVRFLIRFLLRSYLTS